MSRNIVFMCVCDVNISVQLKQLHYWEWEYFLWWVGGRVSTRSVGLQVIAEKMNLNYKLLSSYAAEFI